MTQRPAVPPPEGQSSNFAHPKDVLHTVNLATQLLCIVVVTIFVVIRIWIKAQYHRNLNAEDYLTVAGWALFMGFCACMLILNSYGGGYNAWDVPETEFIKFQKASYATTLIYVPMVFIIKVALLAVMGRVFAPHRRKIKVIYISIVIMLCYYIPALFIKIFFCEPISAYWLGTLNGGKCLDQRKVIIADSVISIAGDLWILVLPVPLIWSLQMTSAKKMRVIGILGAGGLATGFSIWRLVIMVVESNTTNTTWFWIHCVLTANAEAGIGLICACLPAMNHFFTAVKNMRSNTNNTDCSKSHELGSWQMHSGRSAAQRTPENFFLPSQNDQAHLISTAAGPEHRQNSISSVRSEPTSTKLDGISRNVTVSQVFEIVR
ncbi:uncharacterized protein N7473_011849 [Penicillium subrubescens]|uniref:uncharacterized protein n=1 Tax=Penicillium subrubescens TaxID=1316194 RepID=UPI00254553D4|nr:uncharacterized protein N7473_011849 [Penicillium subrubescens]KAJ5880796.1 hypothetical protein N7473_011849 [Penicillium subrubescens]